jgi:cardiolipin synthase (CMP-forming)
LQSIWGGILDPIGDKIFVGSIAAGLMMKGLFPSELFALTIGRDLILIGSGLIIRGLEKEKNSAFFDASSATFEIVPTQLSKVNTALQFILLSMTLSHFYTGTMIPTIDYIQPLWYLTAVTTLGSGVQYLNGNGLKKIRSGSQIKNRKRFTWD